MTLTIQPKIAHNITFPWVYWDNWFSEEELKSLEDYCSSLTLTPGSVVDPDPEKVINTTIRQSNIHMVYPTQDTQWIFQKLLSITEMVNKDFYRFDLYGFEFFQYSEYYGSGDKYDMHMDMIMGHEAKESNGLDVPRKLSIVMCLSDPADYEGGEFHIFQGNVPQVVEQKRGRLLVFPSWMLHAVTPVTKGVRKSIVVWVLGPKFK